MTDRSVGSGHKTGQYSRQEDKPRAGYTVASGTSSKNRHNPRKNFRYWSLQNPDSRTRQVSKPRYRSLHDPRSRSRSVLMLDRSSPPPPTPPVHHPDLTSCIKTQPSKQAEEMRYVPPESLKYPDRLKTEISTKVDEASTDTNEKQADHSHQEEAQSTGRSWSNPRKSTIIQVRPYRHHFLDDEHNAGRTARATGDDQDNMAAASSQQPAQDYAKKSHTLRAPHR
ncbi:hypothetical protein ACOMHN_042490 [Nucella lapillus]